MNIDFTPLSAGVIRVSRHGESLGVILRDVDDWALYLEPVPDEGMQLLYRGRKSAAMRHAIERWCTCGECPKDKRRTSRDVTQEG